jgi:hypothetical protein
MIKYALFATVFVTAIASGATDVAATLTTSEECKSWVRGKLTEYISDDQLASTPPEVIEECYTLAKSKVLSPDQLWKFIVQENVLFERRCEHHWFWGEQCRAPTSAETESRIKGILCIQHIFEESAAYDCVMRRSGTLAK